MKIIFGTKEEVIAAKSSLTKRWDNPKDVNTAISMMVWMDALDGIIFPGQFPLLQFIRKPKQTRLAHYSWPQRKRAENYGIYLDNLAARIEKARQAGKIFGVKGATCYTRKEMFLSCAAHEGRHRLQHRGLVRMFRKRDAKRVKDPLLAETIAFTVWLFRCVRAEYRKQKKSWFFIRKQLNKHEFDATVIEIWVANLVRRKATMEEIAEAVKRQT